MSDKDRKDAGTTDDLDLDSALDEWEADLARGEGVVARSAPMPQKPAEPPPVKKAPAAPPRPLYRPPSGGKMPAPPIRAPKDAPARPASPGDSSIFEDGRPEDELTPMREAPAEEEDQRTRIAAMPSELLDSLLGGAPSPFGDDKEGDIDLDDLLGGLGEAPQEPKVPKPSPAAKPPVAGGTPGPTAPKPAPPRGAPPPLARPPLPMRGSLTGSRPTVPNPVLTPDQGKMSKATMPGLGIPEERGSQEPTAPPPGAKARHVDLSDDSAEERSTPVVPVPAVRPVEVARAPAAPRPPVIKPPPGLPPRPGVPGRPSLDALRAKRESQGPASALGSEKPATPASEKPATLDDLDAMLDSLGPPAPADPESAPPPPPGVGGPEPVTKRPPPPTPTSPAGPIYDEDVSVVQEDLDGGDVDSMLDSLAPPASDAPPPPVQAQRPPPLAPAAATENADRGAAAALRSVRSRKPRKETFALVGRGPEGVAARRALLEALAESAKGAPKARLLTSAAELCEQLGEAEAARGLYARAREADPLDPIAIRAVRRTAVANGAWTDVAQLLEAEAGLPLGVAERSHTLALLAEIAWRELGDAKSAAATIDRALELEPVSPLVALLAAEIRFASGDDAGGAAALEKAAGATSDSALAAVLFAEAARVAEQRGDDSTALSLFERAVKQDPTALDACLGLARSARKAGKVDVAIAAASRAAGLVGGGAVREALLREAAVLAHRGAGRPAEAVSILADARGVSAHRARAEAAAAAGDTEARLASLEGWAAASGATERALALVELAEVRAEGGDVDGADNALRDASLADPNLGLVRVVRELLARKTGDSARLARLVESSSDGQSGGALVAAAKVARDRGASERERELLERAADEDQSPVTADVLRLDVAAEQQDGDAVRIAVRRQADRATPEQRLGALLVLADLAMRASDGPAADAFLREAREGAHGEPVALRPLARLLAASAPIESAALRLEESTGATGEPAAYAATIGGRLLETVAPSDAIAAYRRALDASPGYAPAAWAMESLARRNGDIDALAHVHEQQADVSADPREAAARLVRAALLRAQDDLGRAATLLERALAIRPEDTIVRDLLLRVSQDRPAGDRAALIEASAVDAPPDVARAARLRAGAAWEQGGDPARAAALYRAVLSEGGGGDAFARLALDRAELAANEIGRVAERKFTAVREATDDDARVVALEELADFDLHDRGDTGSAVLSLQSILEVAPGHIPSLRSLERYYLEQSRDEDLLVIEERLAAHTAVPHDVSAHLRLAVRLRLRPGDATGEAADPLLLELGKRAEMDLWLARRVEAAAHAASDWPRTAEAADATTAALSGPSEKASAAVRAAEAHARAGTPAQAASALRTAVSRAQDHPVATEELAKLEAAAGDHPAAAEAFELAARATKVPSRAVSLWHRAAMLWNDEVGDTNRAATALQAAAGIDAAHADVFPRLVGILRARRATRELADLTAARVAAGGDPTFLVGLYVELAGMRMELQERDLAIEALRSALALEPDRVEALRSLAEFCFQDEDWRGATEALIRIARLTKDRQELRAVFYRLGEIYDEHMPDAKRAEAAYRRALKLVEDDIPTMERLAKLYRREGDAAQAAEMIARLAEIDVDPDRSRGHKLEHAAMLEQKGDARASEQILEQTRRNAPTDLGVLRAIADFYGRQNAQTALAMHLNRAVNDFRHAIDADATDHAAWSGLVQVLGWRGRPDAARCCASAAAALGIVDVELGRVLDAHGAVPGGGSGSTDSELDDLLAPEMLSPGTRAVFRMAADAIEKTLPFDPRQIRAERVGRDNPMRQQLDEVSRWFGVSDVELYVTSIAPRVCVPVSGSPVSIVVGRDIFSVTDEREKLFLLARAFKIARSSLAVAVRSQPGDLALVLAGLIRSFDMNYAPAGFAPAQLDDMARRVGKHINKRVRDELLPNVLEMGGMPGFDPMRMALAASELGDRVGLVATGSAPSALRALLKLAGEAALPTQTSAIVAAVRRLPSASTLLAFAVSDAHFEARHRAGADRR